MKKYTLAALGAATLASLALAAPPDTKLPPKKPMTEMPQPKPQPKPQSAPPKKKTFKGTAECQMKCANGQCRPESCSVSGCLTKEDAERRLRAELKAKVTAEGGTINGEISVSVSLEF